MEDIFTEIVSEKKTAKGGKAWDTDELTALINKALDTVKKSKKAAYIPRSRLLSLYKGDGNEKYANIRIKRKIVELFPQLKDKIEFVEVTPKNSNKSITALKVNP